MNEQKQINTFEIILMDQRNLALNEVAYWRAKVIELEAQLKKEPDVSV